MFRSRYLALIFSILFLSFKSETQSDYKPAQKIIFPSSDALLITADLYFINDTLPYMVLCHQAGFSRGEYLETAKEFCKFGYNCIAIDARSGNEVNGVKNETAAHALKQNKPTTYLDAEQDIIAAINYAYNKSGRKVCLIGSSYSASLCLKIAATNKKISAVIAFSPGECFGATLKLKDAIVNLSVPVFVTSSKEEAADLMVLVSEVKSKIKKQFIPTYTGKHGSSCLWRNNPDQDEYWTAVRLFMDQLK